MKASDTSALLEIIKEQNKTIESLRKTIDEMNVNSKLLCEQIDYLNKSSSEQRVRRRPFWPARL